MATPAWADTTTDASPNTSDAGTPSTSSPSGSGTTSPAAQSTDTGADDAAAENAATDDAVVEDATEDEDGEDVVIEDSDSAEDTPALEPGDELDEAHPPDTTGLPEESPAAPVESWSPAGGTDETAGAEETAPSVSSDGGQAAAVSVESTVDSVAEEKPSTRTTTSAADDEIAPADLMTITTLTPSDPAPAPAPFVRQPETPLGVVLGAPGAIINIATKVVGMLLAPIFNPGPTNPAEPPLIWAVLAFARREIQRTFFNSSPTAVGDVASTSEGAPTTIAVLGNDTDPNAGDVLTVGQYTQAQNGTVVLNTDGSFTYTPDAGFTGTDTFTYTISDEASPWHVHGLASQLRGGHSATAAVTITVTEVNAAPVAGADTATVSAGSVATFIDVLANDADANGDALTIIDVTQPANGTAAFTGFGVTYTPAEGFAGTETFTYTVSDGIATSVGTVTVTVTPVVPANQPPVAVDDTFTMAPGATSATVNVVANDTDPDGDDLTVTAVTGAANGTATFTGGTITYTPTAGFAGTEVLTYTVSDGTDTATATLTITVPAVNKPPVAANDTFTMAPGATSATVNVVSNDTDADGDDLTVTALTGAANGTATFTGGTITYTPTAGFAGTEVLTYTVSDGTDTATATLTITVPAVNKPPVAANDTFTMAPGATSATVNVVSNDTDADGDDLTVTALTGAANGTATFTGGTITYTPTAGFAGTEVLTYTVSDGTDTATATLTITVPAVNKPPVAANDTFTMAPGATSATVNVVSNDTDADGDDLTVTALTGAANGTATFTGGTITYTPTAGFAGTEVLTYTVSDGTDTATATLTITVPAVNKPPVAANDTFTMAPGATSATVNVVSNDTDADGDDLTVTALTGAANGTATFTGGTITYTPTAGFAGTEVLTYTVSDGTDSTTATLTITVPAVNKPPVAADDTFTMPAGATSATINVVANDTDPDNDTLALVGVTGATNGTTTFTGGSITYTPTTGFAGTETLTYTVTDGTTTATGTLTITVPAVNLASDDTFTFPTDATTATINVLANDADPDTLTITDVTGATNGTATFSSTSITYTPAAGFAGTETLTYTVTDGTRTDTATLTIAVPRSNILASDDTFTFPTDATTATINVLANDADPDTLTITDVTGATNGTATFSSTSITYTPATGFIGTETLTYTVTDGTRTDTATLTITVRAHNNPPIAADPGFTSTTDPATGVVTGRIHVTDADSHDALAYTITSHSDPALGSVAIDPATGEFTFTATRWAMHQAWRNGSADFAHFAIGVSDGIDSIEIAVDAEITPANAAPHAYQQQSGYQILSVDLSTGVVTGRVLAADEDGDALAFGISSPTQDSMGDLTLDAATGYFTFTPSETARQLAESVSGAMSLEFTVTVTDGWASTDIVVLTPVTPFNYAPFANDPAYTVTHTNSVTGSIIGAVHVTDVSPGELGVLTFTLQSGVDPELGTVFVDSTTGAFAFNPTLHARQNAWYATEPHTVTFTIAASDPLATTHVEVTVSIAGAPPGSSSVVVDGLTGVPGRYDKSTLYGPAVAANGRVYQSISEWDPIGRVYITTITVVTASNGAATSFDAMGEPAHPLLIGSDGVAYQVLEYRETNRARTGVLTITPDGQSTFSGHTDGQISGLPVIGTDGTVYVTLTNATSGTADPSVLIARPGRQLGVVALPGQYLRGPLVAGHDGKLYVVSYSPQGSSTTHLTVITGGDAEHFSTPGQSGDRVAITADGVVYLVATPGYEATVFRVTAEGLQALPHTISGSLLGEVVQSLDGNLYQNISDGPGRTTLAVIDADGLTPVAAPAYSRLIAGPGGRLYEITSNFDASTGRYDATVSLVVNGVVVVSVTLPGLTYTGTDSGTHLLTFGTDGTAYLTTTEWSEDGEATTRVAVIKPDGTATIIPVTGAPSGRIVAAQEGTAYLSTTAWDHVAGTGTTRVAVITPSGSSVVEVPGLLTQELVLGADGVAYATTNTVGDGSGTARIAVITPGGTTIHTVGNLSPDPTTARSVGNVTVSPSGIAYQTFVVDRPGTGPHTVVATVSVDALRLETIEIPGIAAGSVTFGSHGTVYQTVVLQTESQPPTTTLHLIGEQRESNNAPTAAQTPFTITAVNQETGAVTGKIHVSDVDGDRLFATVTKSIDSAIGTLTVESSGVFTFTPTPGAREDSWSTPSSRTASFAVSFSDGQSSVAVTVEVPILPANHAPVAESPSFGFTTDPDTGVVTGTVNVHDIDPDDELTYTLVSGVDADVAQIEIDSRTGEFTITPAVATRENAWTSGGLTLSFTVRADDGLASTEATVTIPVAPQAPVNDAPHSPTLSIDQVYTGSGVVIGTVTATDPDSDPLTYRLGTFADPALGSVVVDPVTGQWAFRATGQARFAAANADGVVDAAFSIIVSDGEHDVEVSVTAPVVPAVDYTKASLQAGNQPTGVAVGADGRIYVTSYTGATITVLNSDGSIADTVDVGAVTDGTPVALATTAAPDGRIYVTLGVMKPDQPMSTAVVVVDPEQDLSVSLFADLPSATVTSLAVGQDGRVYAYSANAQGVIVLGSDGIPYDTLNLGTLLDIGYPSAIRGIAMDPNGLLHVAATGADSDAVFVLNPDGSVESSFDVDAAGQIAVGADGRVYILDVYGSVTAYRDGSFVGFTDLSAAQGYFGMAVGSDGRIYVAELATNSVLVFSQTVRPTMLYGVDNVDANTGAVSGRIFTLNPAGRMVFSLNTAFDPALGRVLLDPATGQWVFKPTRQARLDAAETSGQDTVSFTVTASDGVNTTTVEIVTAIEPTSAKNVIAVDVIGRLDGSPSGVAVDSAGRVYILNSDTGTLTIRNTDGSHEPPINLGGVLFDIAVGADGRIFVSELDTGHVLVLDPAAGNGPAIFASVTMPTGLAVDGAGRLYVASGTTSTVTILNPDGSPATPLDVGGGASDIAVSSDGRVYTLRLDGTLLITEPDGTPHVTTLRAQGFAVAVDADGVVYVTHSSGGDVTMLDADGTVIANLGIPGRMGYSIAVDADGLIYITDAIDRSVKVVTLGTAGTGGEAPSYGDSLPGFPGDPSSYTPTGPVVGPDGKVYQIVAVAGFDGTITTRMLVLGHTISHAIPGAPAGKIVFGADGSAYQALFDARSGTTTVLYLDADGEFLTTPPVNGVPVGNIVTGSNGSAFLTAQIHDYTTVLVITPFGSSSETFTGRLTTPLNVPNGLVVLNGTAYLVMSEGTTEAPVTRVAILSHLGSTVHEITGMASGLPVAGADGRVYLTISDSDFDAGRFSTRLVTVMRQGIAEVGDPVDGMPMGGPVLTPNGQTYQLLLRPRVDRTVVDAVVAMFGPTGFTSVSDLVPADISAFGSTVFGSDGTAYHVLSQGFSSASVMVVTPEGDLAFHTLPTHFNPSEHPTLAGPNGVAYRIGMTDSGLAVLLIRATGVTTVELGGSAAPTIFLTPIQPVITPDGTLYQALREDDTTTVTVASVSPNGDLTTHSTTGEFAELSVVGNRVFVSIVSLNEDTQEIFTTLAVVTPTGIRPVAERIPGAAAGGVVATASGDVVQSVVFYAEDNPQSPWSLSFTLIGHVSDFNAAPQPSQTPYTTSADAITGVVNGDIHVVDTDHDTLTYALSSAVDPGFGTVSLDSATGTWVFTPTLQARHAASDSPDAGAVTFVVNVFDGAATTPITVTLNIVPLSRVNHAPVAVTNDDSITVDHATASTTGTIDSVDADGDTITFTLATPPDPGLGTVTVNPVTGTWTFRPSREGMIRAWSTNAAVAVQFTVSASDGQTSTPVVVTTSIDDAADALAALLERAGSRPAGIALGPDGRVYVIDSGAATLTIFEPTNWTSTTVSVGSSPSAIAIDLNNRVWVTNSGDNTVSVLDRNGGFIGSARVGSTPTAVAIDRFGRAFVVNSGDGTISVLGPNEIHQPGYQTVAVGDAPNGIAVGPDDRVYVTNSASHSVTIIDPANDYAITTISDAGANPYGIAVGSDGTVYVTNPFVDAVTVLTPDTSGGYTRRTITLAGTPTAITVGQDGRIYVTNAADGSITTIDPATFATTTITVGSNPNAVVQAPTGEIYVTNGGSGTVSVVPSQSTVPPQAVVVGSRPYTVTVGANNSLIIVNNHTAELTVVPAKPGAPLALDVSSATSPLGTPWAVGPNGITYYLKNTGFIFPEVSVVAYDATGREMSSSAVAFMYDRYPHSPVVAGDGSVYFLMQSVNYYRDNFEEYMYVMMVDPLKSGGLHYMYNTLNRVDDPRPEDLRSPIIGPDGRLYVQSSDYVLVFDPDGNPWGERIPFTHSEYLSFGMTVGPDGKIYGYTTSLIDDDPKLEVIDPVTRVSTIVDLPHAAGQLLVGPDGRIYLTGYTDTTVTVLKADYSVATVLDLGFSPYQLTMGPNGYVVIPTSSGVAVINPNDNYSMKSIQLGGSTSIVPDPTGNGAIYLSTWTDAGTKLTRLSLPGAYPPLDEPGSVSKDVLSSLIEWALNHPAPTEATLVPAMTEFLTDGIHTFAKFIHQIVTKPTIKPIFDGLPSSMKDATLDYISGLADGRIRIEPSKIDQFLGLFKTALKVIGVVSSPFDVFSAWHDSNAAETETEKLRAAIATIGAWAPFFGAAVGGIVAGPAGIVVGWGAGSAISVGLSLGNLLAGLILDATQPDPPAPEPPHAATSPSSMADLYSRLRDVTANSAEGVYIETVLDDEGQDPRLIVYLGGTDPANWASGNQAIIENNAYFHQTKSEHLAAIDAALEKAPGARIMLVGYSQGGMDAQNIAASGHYNVTTVVTYGAPIVQPASTAYRTIHLWAENDRVTDFTFRRYEDYYEEALNNGQLFKTASSTEDDGWWKIHGEVSTYREIGDAFDDSPVGNQQKYWGVKNNIQQFLGQPVLDIPDGSVFVDGTVVARF
ncbi:Ig-like domain-containing protein [Mycobacterium sp. TJFP1]